ncbi:MAG: hypothetical protein H7Y36_10350 [Armatimonadetes bacterium]|nr:hypothetical protein [Akkermansiaceae bacterium]
MRLALKMVMGLVLLSGTGGMGWWIWQADQDYAFSVILGGKKPPKPDKERYEVLVAETQRWRNNLGKSYKKARNAEERAAVENDARAILELMIPEMLRCWLGTPWDFNGIAEKPGEGKVACGYFVSTVIRDAGFKVNRYELAKQPSENIMRTFLSGESCLLEVGRNYEEYADWVEGMSQGVYLIGLDTHVGFIVNQKDGMHFIHSSGSKPWCVVEEGREMSAVLKKSNWRMIGALTGNGKVIGTWLRGDKVRVRN